MFYINSEEEYQAIVDYQILRTFHLDPGKLSERGYISACTELLVKKPEKMQADMRVIY